MKAISLWEPWASLVAWQEKKYETRSWYTPYRGNLAIHAAKIWAREQKYMLECEYFLNVLEKRGIDPRITPVSEYLGFGCIIAAVEVVNVIPVEKIRDDLSDQELAFGNYAKGRFAWELKFIKVPAEPIPTKGMQGLFDWNPA